MLTISRYRGKTRIYKRISQSMKQRGSFGLHSLGNAHSNIAQVEIKYTFYIHFAEVTRNFVDLNRHQLPNIEPK